MKKFWLGIDLGTLNLKVAVCSDKLTDSSVEMVQNDAGKRSTPNYFLFRQKGVSAFGDSARNSFAKEPRNRIYGANVLLGKRCDDEVIKESLFNCSTIPLYKKGDELIFQVVTPAGQLHLSPEQMVALQLERASDITVKHLEQKGVTCDSIHEVVKGVALTVPAVFTYGQKQAFHVAAKMAGFDEVKFIPSPLAAAIHYTRTKKISACVMCVLDIGAMYVSAAVVDVSDGEIQILSLSGDAGTGGLAFDSLLFSKASEEIRQKLGKHPKEDPKSLNKVLLACEKAKNDLSASQKCVIDLDGLFDEQTFHGCAERNMFNQITEDVCGRVLGVVKCVLSEANIVKNGFKCQNKKEAIDEVIMVGGASRIPMLEDVISTYFGRPVGRQVNIDESLAQGAALGVKELSSNRNEIKQVLPLPIGVEIKGVMMKQILPRHVALPASSKANFAAVDEHAQGLLVQIYEGTHIMTRENTKLAEIRCCLTRDQQRSDDKQNMQWSQIQEASGTCLTVEVEANQDGHLSVVARTSMGNALRCQMAYDKGRYTSDKIEAMEQLLKSFRENEKRYKTLQLSRNTLEEDLFVIKERCDEALQWLQTHESADEADLKKQRIQLREFCLRMASSMEIMLSDDAFSIS